VSSEGKQLETVADQFGLRRLYPRTLLFNSAETDQRTTCAIHPSIEKSMPVGLAPIGGCEFIGELVDSGCEGRYWSDGTFCSVKIFADPKVFVGCATRKDRLKIKQGT
jgi:hypothetical protein